MNINIKSSLGNIELQEPSWGAVSEMLDGKTDKEFVEFLLKLQEQAGKSTVNIKDLPYREQKKVISSFFSELNSAPKE